MKFLKWWFHWGPHENEQGEWGLRVLAASSILISTIFMIIAPFWVIAWISLSVVSWYWNYRDFGPDAKK